MTRIKHATEMTFDDDCLELRSFADQFERYLEVDQLFATGSLVVSLEAPFGSGKTAFLSMWFKRLLERRKTNEDRPIPVLLNAWEDDFATDPFIPIISSLIDKLEEQLPNKHMMIRPLRKTAQEIAWFGLALANGYVQKSTGFDLIKAGEIAEAKTASDNHGKTDLFRLYKTKKNLLNQLKDNLSRLLSNENRIKTIICVDELDRCRPDYAIQYLETIKHIFNVPGIVFVLAIDRAQISSSARALFGSDLQADEYLRKFIARTFLLPKPSEATLTAIATDLFKRFVHVDNVRKTKFPTDPDSNRALIKLCLGLGFTPRQLEDVFRLMGYVFSSSDQNRKVYQSWCNALIFLCCLKTHNQSLYHNFCTGSTDILKLRHQLIEKLDPTFLDKWLCLCHTGFINDIRKRYVDLLSEAKIPIPGGNEGDRVYPLMENEFRAGWGPDRSDNTIVALFKRIESAACF